MAADDGAGPRIAFQCQAGVFPFPHVGGGGGGGGDGDQPAHHRQLDPRWNGPRNGRSASEGEDEEEEEDVDYDGGEDEDGLVSLEDRRNIGRANTNSSGSSHNCSEKVHDEGSNNPRDLNSTFGISGSGRGLLTKDSNGGTRCISGVQQCLQLVGHAETVTVAENSPYYAHGDHAGSWFSTPRQQELGAENECGSSGGREIGMSVGSWETIRSHLSDPVTDILMDDAMVLSCGHSYGSGGIQHIFAMKACFKCGQPVRENLVRPNLALRAAVRAFCREEESQSFRTPKRRRDRMDQGRCNHEDTFPMDLSRGKSLHFPFAISDRVMIKGNKRTPQRFVGRVAVVTAQCLNGWYVVKTLDSAETIKLQYRSLEKVADEQGAANNSQTPNWL